MDDEELHPIEQDDGIVAPEVLQVVEEHQAAANQDPDPDDNQPNPGHVFNRLLDFESTLKGSWDDFKETLVDEVKKIKDELSSVDESVDKIMRMEKHQIDFAIGDSVVLLEERKVGRVTKVTTLCVDVLLDGEQNSKKTVRKKKTAVMRLHFSIFEEKRVRKCLHQITV